MTSSQIISSNIEDHIKVIRDVSISQAEKIDRAADKISKSLATDGTLFFCGNGGSAADSQHLAAELVGRFKKDRKALRSIALTTDSSVISCISNDYSYSDVFSRQLEALGREGDVLVAISTSGNSANIVRVLQTARLMDIFSVCLLGRDGGKAKELCDLAITISSCTTARIQEAHGLVGHILCDLIERALGYA